MSLGDRPPDPPQVLDPETLARHDAVLARLAGYRQFITEVAETMARARAEVHTGRDDDGAVTARVDGDGLVVGVTLERAAARLDSRDLSAAVLAAVRGARHQRTEALLALATRIQAARGAER